MAWSDVQALLLRPAHEPAVAHLLFRVAPGAGGGALERLKALLQAAPLTCGDDAPRNGLHCTIGFTYRGLEALAMPEAYLRVFSRLAPAFKQGAPLRAARLGDTADSAPASWVPGFGLDEAHVLLSVHGSAGALREVVAACRLWPPWPQAPLLCVAVFEGQRLGAPDHRAGEWVHFGFRDGLVNHCVAGVYEARPSWRQQPTDTEHVAHAAGEFLLGHADDDGTNPFALTLAPAKVRDFFRDSSFGVLRPMRQDVAGFHRKVEQWAADARAHLGEEVSEDWVRAKLGGRWPSGEQVRPGALAPTPDEFVLDFQGDPQGLGCPWCSHVRRMDARGHAGSGQRQRPLLRRGMPYGSANWKGEPDEEDRGLLGLFFCASLEDQFELLVGQWARGAPPGDASGEGEMASDVLAGHNGAGGAAAIIPLAGQAPLRLTGLRAWTRTLGTAYTWHPARPALECVLAQDYPEKDKGGPWL